jgi:hypothetical protein
MLVRANSMLMGLCIVAGLAFPAMAQQPLPCASFTRNLNGDWVAVRNVTVPGANGAVEIKKGRIASDELQDRLNTQCR